VLLVWGASPNVILWWKPMKRSASQVKSSALFICFRLSMKFLDCDTSLPRLLISKGGKLLQGKLERLCKFVRSYEPHLFDSRSAFLRSFFPGLELSPKSDSDDDDSADEADERWKEGTRQRRSQRRGGTLQNDWKQKATQMTTRKLIQENDF